MILKGSQRGNGDELALHLLKTEDNEHVEIHEIRNLSSETLKDAFYEIESVSNATKCRQYLFSVSLNPPQKETASIEDFENAINAIENKLSLDNQPRVVVFHEKEGRRHAHCVWSRIDAEGMKAINLPHYKNKLNDLSKELFLQHEWELPKGYIDRSFRDPASFTLQEWQQAKRTDQDPRMLKAMFRQAWERSNNPPSYMQALQSYGFVLARGDRRGFVAVDYKGEVYSLSRWSGQKPKALTDRLGKPKFLPSVEEAKNIIANKMTDALDAHIQTVRRDTQKKYLPVKNAAITMRNKHRHERDTLEQKQNERWHEEETHRMKRVPRGLKSMLSRITGRYKKIRNQNEQETMQCRLRDQNEKQKLVEKQLHERQKLQDKIQSLREERNEVLLQMRKDIGQYMDMKEKRPDAKFEFTQHEEYNRIL